ncbi:MAG: DNA polymerase [Anaeroplasma sp.]
MIDFSKKILHIDIETYSDVDIREVGVYRYVNDPSFEILLIAYAYETDFDIEEHPVKIFEEVNRSYEWNDLMNALLDPNVIKVAHNANFEMTCFEKYLHSEKLLGCSYLSFKGRHINPSQWICSANLASIHGYPRSLDKLGIALGLPDDAQKNKIGKSLIQYFCKPCKPTKSNGERTRNRSWHDMAKWNLFKEYCMQDVFAEHECLIRLMELKEVHPVEHNIWELDQKSNAAGVLIEKQMAQNISSYNTLHQEQTIKELVKLTKLDNPNSNEQLTNWLIEQGIETESIDKEARDNIINSTDNKLVKKVLNLKNSLSKSSLAKYDAMLKSICDDGTVKGMLQYYGATHTGRWAGRIVQLHNLPKNHMELKWLNLARNLVLINDFDTLEDCFNNVPDVLSQLIRTTFIAKPGNTFIVCDYSAIEARIISWLANEKWRMEVFANNGDIYCASASQMYGVPVEKHGINGELRAKGKVAELALGYQGAVGALTAMDYNNELSEADKESILNKWRKANPNIVKMWSDVEEACIKAVCNPGVSYNTNKCNIEFISDDLYITLPSGRWIKYRKARVKSGKLEFIDISDRGTEIWAKTYGGKIVENIVQATARDCLAVAMLRLDAKGYNIKFHVHDEVIVEVKSSIDVPKELEKIKDIMGENAIWMDGLILTADGYFTPYYMKD